MEDTQVQPLIPGLPDDLALECLTRVHSSAHGPSTAVCRAWRGLLNSPEYRHRRKQNGHTTRLACLIQSIPGPEAEPEPDSPPAFGITLFDLKAQTWDQARPMPSYPDGLPLYCQVACTGPKLVIMGGWDPKSRDPVSHVFVYDLTTRTWRRGQDMPAKRSLFAVGAIDGQVLVAGGHDPDKNASDSAWVYDVAEDGWTELTRMSEERDECRGLVLGPEFWVISGYRTRAQGAFGSSADVYNIETGLWKRVEGVWSPGQNPRSCVGFGTKGQLINWAKPNSSASFGKCIVDVGDEVILYDNLISGFYLINKEKCAIGNFDYEAVEELDVPYEYLGFVISGCSAEF